MEKIAVIVLKVVITTVRRLVLTFYPNVTVRSGICYRKSVCLSSVVRAHSAGWNFWQCFYAILYLSRPLTSSRILWKLSQGPPVSG